MAEVAPAFLTVPGDVREPSDFIGNFAGQGERRQEDEDRARSVDGLVWVTRSLKLDCCGPGS